MYKISSFANDPFESENLKWTQELTGQMLGLGERSRAILQKILISPVTGKPQSPEEEFQLLIQKELEFRGFLTNPKLSSQDEIVQSYSNFPTRIPEMGFFHSTPCYPHALPTENQIAFFGVPSDLGAKHPGCRYGPDILRSKSVNFHFRSDTPRGLFSLSERNDCASQIPLYDCGNFFFPGENLSFWLKQIEHTILNLPLGTKPFTIGGDHSFSYPVIKSLAKRVPRLKVLQFDSHLDLQLWGGFTAKGPKQFTTLEHSNFLSHLARDCANLEVFHIGARNIQSVDPTNIPFICEYLEKCGTFISDQETFSLSSEEVCCRFGTGHDVYITVDVDVLARNMMSETGFPAAMGIDFAKLIQIVKTVGKTNNVIGFDIMEYGNRYSLQSSSSELLCLLICEAQNILGRGQK